MDIQEYTKEPSVESDLWSIKDSPAYSDLQQISRVSGIGSQTPAKGRDPPILWGSSLIQASYPEGEKSYPHMAI